MSKQIKNKDKIQSEANIGWHSIGLILDRQARIKFVTKPLAVLLGYTVNELIGKNAIKLFLDKNEYDDRRSEFDFIYKQDGVIDAFDIELKNRKKERVSLRFSILKLSSSTTNTEDIALIGDNLAVTKKTNSTISNPESQLLDIINSAREIVIIIDSNEEIRSVTEVGLVKFGIKSGMFLKDLLEPQVIKKTTSFLNSLSKISSTAKINLVFLHPETKQRIYLAGTVGSIVVAFKLKEFRLILTDVTEQIKTEKAKNLYYAIAHHSIHSKNLAELYYNIHKELKQVVDCENLFIAIREKDLNNNILTFPYYQEANFKTFDDGQRKFDKGVSEYIINTKKPQLFTKKDLLKLSKEKKIALHTKIPEIWLGVPLKVQSEVIGVIAIQSYHNKSFYSDRDLKLLDFSSSQIAMAINMVRTQEKLKSQTAKLNSIIESSTHLIWTVDSEFELTSFNKNYLNAIINNYDVMPDVQEGNSNIIKPFYSFWEEKYRQVFDAKPLNFEVKLKDKDDNEVWKEIFLNPIYLDGGRIEEVLGIANDITEKKKSGQALIESEEKFRNIFESFQDVYFRCDRNGIVNMVSPSVKNLIGLSVNHVIGKNVVDFYANDGSILPMLKKLMRKQQLKNVEFTLSNKKKNLIECICNLSLITDINNKALFIEGVVRDVTLLRLTNKELILAKDLAEASLQVKEQFLANMSHEIRTPLNGIIGVLDLLELTKLDKEQGSYLKTIKASSETLLNILNDILDLSKIEAGKMRLRLTAIAPNKLIGKLESLFASRAASHQINLQFHLSHKIPKIIEADEMRLIQVISNLIANSIKFTPSGGSIDIAFELKSELNDELFIKVNIRDSGIGISKQDIKKLFTNFTQLDTSTTKSYRGTGLGLSISKQLVEIMGGKIGVFSNPGLGSTFWFSFKAKKTTKKLIKEETQVLRDGLQQFTDLQPSILVVDDNQVNREVASEILKKCGCNIDLAENGIEAVFKAKQYDYDIILMDIQMPEMDGIEANRQIKMLDKEKQPIVVAMTAYSMKEDEEKFLAAGLDDYLSKPIRASQLINKVEQLFMGSSNTAYEADPKKSTSQIINQDIINQLQKYGGKDLVFNTFQEFREEAEELIKECTQALLNKDYNSIAKIMHTLKGTAGTLGIEKIAQVSQEIETYIKKEEYAGLNDSLIELGNNFAEFNENFTNIIEQY